MKKRSPRNRSLHCSEQELLELEQHLISLTSTATYEDLENRIIWQDFFDLATYLPRSMVDLLILDPPYNLSKDYNGTPFRKLKRTDYRRWFETLVETVLPLLKPEATVYVCSDWSTSVLVAPILDKTFHVRNRITWEREKGRGSLSNWKNNAEDIWFCTVSNQYTFNVHDVKMKRKVIAPYRTREGKPKDWQTERSGNFRETYPSNIWTDITVPFWSMAENTDHPTQKSEKLFSKLILASSNQGDLVFDPFLGSGTSAVASYKLGRRFVGVESNKVYCCWAVKRLEMAKRDTSIQGYAEGMFWDRNTFAEQGRNKRDPSPLQGKSV